MAIKFPILRVARPTDNLQSIVEMYQAGLELDILCEFYDHEGFDGVVLGGKGSQYHLEFTHHRGTSVGKAPTFDNLIAFYIEDRNEWARKCSQAELAGFKPVVSYNPYWDLEGKTYEDLDGYRVVLQNSEWGL